MIISPADFDDAQLIALLKLHLSAMHANSPPGSVHALDLSGLKAPGVSVYAAWQDDMLVGMGALKELDAVSGEIKSMRTHPAHLRQGVASAVYDHLLAVAISRRYRRISLETGSGPAFEPALALYRARGFRNGSAFGDYLPTAFNQFLHLDIG